MALKASIEQSRVLRFTLVVMFAMFLHCGSAHPVSSIGPTPQPVAAPAEADAVTTTTAPKENPPQQTSSPTTMEVPIRDASTSTSFAAPRDIYPSVPTPPDIRDLPVVPTQVGNGSLTVMYVLPNSVPAERRVFLINGEPRGFTNEATAIAAGTYTVSLGPGGAYTPESKTIIVLEQGHATVTFTAN
jgi:hypothetical protein